MGDKILKVVEAILGGVATFIGGMYLMGFILDMYPARESFMGNLGLGVVFLFVNVVFSFFMVFVYYHLLTKNKIMILTDDSLSQNSQKSVFDEKKTQIALGLVCAFAYFYLLSLYDGLTAFFYTLGSVFILPFILTRKWSWLERIMCLIIVFIVGFLIAFISYS